MKKILLALALLAFATPAFALVQLNVTVPGSGTAFNFDQDGSSHDWAVTGILGIAGDNQADVTSGHALLMDTPTTSTLYAAIVADPCGGAKSTAPVNLTASGQVITGTAAKKTHICGGFLISATTQNINIVEGTGTTCATNIFGLTGGTTPATGPNLAANTGFLLTPDLWGSGDANATAANTCILSSSTGQISGYISYVQL